MPATENIETLSQTPVLRDHSGTFSRVALAVVAIALWGRVIEHQSVEWTVNEQYAYGWAVPFLCAFLLRRRWMVGRRCPQRATCDDQQASPVSSAPPGALRTASPCLLAAASLVVVAFLFTRWIEEANPDWRLVSWALALEVIGLTLAGIYFIAGKAAAKHFAFPILFFLVAVPWPTAVEQATIQTLTRGIVAATVELLNAFGFPALPHGNIIETATGLVDVDQACSGIRSLQAALMLALFFGELRCLAIKQRVILCGVGFVLACLFNLGRTVVLSFVAAEQGSAAVQRWHDPAGVIILVACFIGIWAVAAWLGRGERDSAQRREAAETQIHDAVPNPRVSAPLRLCVKPSFIIAVAILLLCGEVAVECWYATGKQTATIDWTAELPQTNPTFKFVELPRAALQILRFNESRSGAWQNSDGTLWQMFYLRWRPGRTAANLARNHTPEICLPAAGKNLRDISEVGDVRVSGLSLPFRCYTTGSNGKPLFVFYTLWEDGANEQHVATQFVTWRTRLKAALERRRNPGQRVIQVALSGVPNVAEAEAALRRELPGLIRVAPSD